MISKILELDAEYTSRLRLAEKSSMRRSLAILFAHSGDSWFLLLGLFGIWLLANSFWKQCAAILIGSILITAVIVLAIKFAVRRRRPEGDWGQIYRKTDPHSFPSGHAARATMLVVVGLGIGPLWLGLLLLFWAPLVILARVAMGVHYVSDVIAGTLFGALIGFGVLGLIAWMNAWPTPIG